MEGEDAPGCRRQGPLTRRRFLAAGGAAAVMTGGYRLAAAQPSPATSIQRGPTNVARVALTFDCGSDRGYAGPILDTLASTGVPCSFGVTGVWAEANPDLLQRMVAEGHHLMNHTYNHPSFTGASTGAGGLTYWQRREQIERTENVIANLTGASTKPYFRPPYGDFDADTLSLLGEIGYRHNALWTLDVLGWNGLSRNQIVDRIAANHGNGYIYLLHVGGASREGPALPGIISTLAGLGYGFATLPQLLAGDGTDPTPKFVAGDTVRVTAGLYLRTAAGTGSDVITTMPTGTVCTVTEGPTHANGYAWYRLTTPYGSGWAAGQFLEKTAAPLPSPAPKFVAGDTVRVTVGLDLRSGAGTSTSVVTTMPTGTTCAVMAGPVAANGYNWYQLDTPYGTGWAADEFLEKAADPVSELIASIIRAILKVLGR